MPPPPAEDVTVTRLPFSTEHSWGSEPFLSLCSRQLCEPAGLGEWEDSYLPVLPNTVEGRKTYVIAIMQGREPQMPFLRMGMCRDCPGGPVAKTPLPVRGAQVQSPVRTERPKNTKKIGAHKNLYMYIYNSFIHNSQKMEPSQKFSNEQVDKQNAIYK